ERERDRNRPLWLLVHQPARLSDTHRDTYRLALERALAVVRRGEPLHLLVKNFAACSRRRHLRTTRFGPHLVDSPGNRYAQDRTGFLRLRPIHGQDAVEQTDIAGQLRHFSPLPALVAL